MAIAAQLYQDDREGERHPVGFNATLRDSTFTPLDVVVEDLSTGGFRVVTQADLFPEAKVGLGLAGIGIHQARIIWRSESTYGCEFVTPLGNDDLRNALSAPSSAPVALPSAPDRGVTLADIPEPRHPGLTARGRLLAITAAAIAAWILMIGIGWVAIRVVSALFPR